MEEDKAKIAQTDPALQSPTEHGSEPLKPEKPKPEKSGKGSKIALVLISILALAGIGFGVYGFFFKKPEEKPTENTANTELESELSNLKQKYSVLQNYVKELEASGTEVPEEAKSAVRSDVGNVLPIVIKQNGLINGGDYNYVFSNAAHQTLAGWLVIGNDSKTVTFTSPNKEYLETNNVTYDPIRGNNTITFDKEVADVYFGGWGQMSGGESLFFLMKDGTVEYMPFIRALTNNDVRSYGKIDGVDGVVKLQMASVSYADMPGGHVTTLAVKNDGTFYDIAQILRDAGN